MGNNYDFRFNEPPLDPNRIEQHKDFAALLEKYQADKPVEKKGGRVIWLGVMAAVAAAIAFLLILRPFGSSVETEDLMAAQEAYFAEKALVAPPIPPADLAFSKQRVTAESGGSYALNPGLRMVVPERAFMDDRGREITGEVELEYREMHDPVDFFLAGMPMQFDSAGRHYQMESAGMIEVYGFQNGQPVQLAPGKTIQVELRSKVRFAGANLSLDFDLFYLDTLAGGWQRSSLPFQQDIEYLKTSLGDKNASDQFNSRLEILADAEAEAIVEAERALPIPQAPVNQYVKPASKPSFELDPANLGDLDTETRTILENNELSGAWWIAAGQAYDQRVLQVGWPEMKLRYLDENLYEMSLIAGDSVVQLQIHPVLIGPEQEEAEKRYEAKLEAYRQDLARWDAELSARKQSIQDSFALERQRLSIIDPSGRSPNSEGNIISRFEVDAFGIWNCDRLLEAGTPKIIDQLIDQTGKVYENHTAYLIDGQKNTVYRFYAGQKTLLEVPGSDRIMIWVINEEQKVACLPRSMNQQALTDDSLETLDLELEDLLIQTPTDLRGILEAGIQ